MLAITLQPTLLIPAITSPLHYSSLTITFLFHYYSQPLGVSLHYMTIRIPNHYISIT
uniref:Uncharacterized protein n=1 Tax=Anguilla anguilla TaxID=7936 RepID=A0A0E9SH12_ANGAN